MPALPPSISFVPKGIQTVNRASATARGYNYRWQQIRKAFLMNNPVCKHCDRLAQEVDHIIPLRKGGTHDVSNLQALCKSCHSKKTARDKHS